MEDELVSSLPIHFSNSLDGLIHIHQYPLLSRPIQTPPSATSAGRHVTARIKPASRRIEVHVPTDIRPDVWNNERGQMLGHARLDDDRERNQITNADDHPNITEVRLRSEEIVQQGTHMLGVIRDGRLHLHPISETHQLRPSLTYLDILSRKSRGSRMAGSDSDSDDGPPPDPDDPAPQPPKKEKKRAGETKEVQVSTRKTEDKGGVQPNQSGTSAVRREMLVAIRLEEDEAWQELDFHDGTVMVAGATESESIFSQNEEALRCKSDITMFLKDIGGL